MLVEQPILAIDAMGTWGVVAELVSSGQQILRINPGEIFPTASVIKIPIIIALYDQAHRTRLDLSASVRITSDLHTSGSGILRYLSDHVVVTIRDLAVLMMQLSDNTAANALISIIGRKQINETLRQLGLYNTELRADRVDAAVAEETPDSIGITTPQDMATLLSLLAQETILESHLCREILDIMRRDRNKQRICGLLPWRSDLVISHKTGTLSGVCHDVGLVRFSQGQYVVSILSKGGVVTGDPHTLATTEQTIAKLSRWIFDRVDQGAYHEVS